MQGKVQSVIQGFETIKVAEGNHNQERKNSNMKIRSSTFVSLLGALLLFSTFAQAERMILKNPSAIPMYFSVLEQVQFGPNKYFVVEDQRPTSSTSQDFEQVRTQTLSLTHSENVSRDLEISLPASQKQITAGNAGWHITKMKYNEIPKGINGNEVVVAVLDTGVSYQHSALRNHMWINRNEIPSNNIDDDNNGYVDDVYGFDFDGNTADPMDDQGHGTHCAGIIASDTKSDGTARGIAQGSKVMALKIIGSAGKGFISNAAKAVKYAVDNGASVMSNSWRIYKSWTGHYNESDLEIFRDAIRYAETKDVLFVAAAGNERRDISNHNDPMYPGGFENFRNILVVASSDSSDNLSSFSNFGARHVHLAAPGSDIHSTYLNDGWVSMSGTSMATPMVAGAIALGVHKGMGPMSSMDQLVRTTKEMRGWKTKLISGGLTDFPKFLK